MRFVLNSPALTGLACQMFASFAMCRGPVYWCVRKLHRTPWGRGKLHRSRWRLWVLMDIRELDVFAFLPAVLIKVPIEVRTVFLPSFTLLAALRMATLHPFPLV